MWKMCIETVPQGRKDRSSDLPIGIYLSPLVAAIHSRAMTCIFESMFIDQMMWNDSNAIHFSRDANAGFKLGICKVPHW
jgi:hypothetical protein